MRDFFSGLKTKPFKKVAPCLRMFSNALTIAVTDCKKISAVSHTGFVRFVNIWWDKRFLVAFTHFAFTANTFPRLEKDSSRKKLTNVNQYPNKKAQVGLDRTYPQKTNKQCYQACTEVEPTGGEESRPSQEQLEDNRGR